MKWKKNNSKMIIGFIVIIIGVIFVILGISLLQEQKKEDLFVDLKVIDANVIDSLKPNSTNNINSIANNNSNKNKPQYSKKEDSKQNDNIEHELNKKQTQNNNGTNLNKTIKEKGYDFEKFVVQKFSKKYFVLLEWAGDKYVNGIYAKTTEQPDLKIEFTDGDYTKSFSVECKYRSNFINNEIEWTYEKQFKNYKKYAIDKKS